ncbi:MAG: hypothetical protein ACTSSP_02855 [Candidatus Asgardarchaeia archaeon]
MGRIRYFVKNWKIGVHLIFRTNRFGVNNKWWSTYDSMFGWSNWKKLGAILTILPLIDNYKRMKFRAGACHFLTDKSYKDAFNEEK